VDLTVLGHERAQSPSHDDQALTGQVLDGLTYGGAGKAVLGDELGLGGQLLAGSPLPRLDARAQVVGQLLGQGGLGTQDGYGASPIERIDLRVRVQP
jgi:hypothetical protein